MIRRFEINLRSFKVSKSKPEENFVTFILYYLSVPTFLLLKKLKVRADTISYLSFSVTFFGCLSLVNFDKNIFIILTIIGLLLDFNDGQIARTTNTVRTHRLPLDHFLDIIKIGMILITLTFYFNQKFLFLITYIFLILFYVYIILIRENRLNTNIELNSKFNLNSISSGKVRGLISIFVLFEAQFYLALIFTVIDIQLFLLWIIWTTFILIIQIIKTSFILKRTKR